MYQLDSIDFQEKTISVGYELNNIMSFATSKIQEIVDADGTMLHFIEGEEFVCQSAIGVLKNFQKKHIKNRGLCGEFKKPSAPKNSHDLMPWLFLIPSQNRRYK